MPIPPTPHPAFPDVPVAPGVPPVLRAASAAAAVLPVLLLADGPAALQRFAPPQWGIYFSDGTPALIADSVLDVEWRQEYRIANAPQEQGAFTSYNKVQLPFDARVTFAQGGTQADRSEFLQELLQAAASLDLLNLVTPEIIYVGVNIVHHGYRRMARHGVSLMGIEVWLEQVRVSGTVQFASGNTGSPSGANAVNIGGVTSLPPEQTGGGVGAAPFPSGASVQ